MIVIANSFTKKKSFHIDTSGKKGRKSQTTNPTKNKQIYINVTKHSYFYNYVYVKKANKKNLYTDWKVIEINATTSTLTAFTTFLSRSIHIQIFLDTNITLCFTLTLFVIVHTITGHTILFHIAKLFKIFSNRLWVTTELTDMRRLRSLATEVCIPVVSWGYDVTEMN